MKTVVVKIDKPEEMNMILGQSHFIKTVEDLHEAMAAALRSPDMVDRLAQSEQTVAADSPADTAARLAQDSKRWGEVARAVRKAA